jgi:hypothetical protein
MPCLQGDQRRHLPINALSATFIDREGFQLSRKVHELELPYDAGRRRNLEAELLICTRTGHTHRDDEVDQRHHEQQRWEREFDDGAPPFGIVRASRQCLKPCFRPFRPRQLQRSTYVFHNNRQPAQPSPNRFAD